MQFNYFNIHSHLNLKPLYEKRGEILERMREDGIGTIVVGVDFETSKLAIEIAEENKDIVWASVGLHPTDNDNENFDYEKHLELAKNFKVVAIGECGLDYYKITNNLQPTTYKEKQKELFKKHIELAIEVGKPLMIHARPSKGSMDAYEEVLDILESYYNLEPRTYNLICNFHFFVGDIAIAERIVKNGWAMSFDGPITFSHEYDEVIRFLPLENIMVETDAPFASPAPHRGKVCEPWMVSNIVESIANIKKINIEIVKKD